MKTKHSLILMLIFFFAASTYSQTASSESGGQTIASPAKESVAAASNFQSDGCTMWFNGEYEGCCQEHDLAYFKSTGWRTRLKADNQLFKCVAKMGFGYSLVAPVMWLGVRIFGSPLFPIHKKRKVKTNKI
jgi:hypothetical protein